MEEVTAYGSRKKMYLWMEGSVFLDGKSTMCDDERELLEISFVSERE